MSTPTLTFHGLQPGGPLPEPSPQMQVDYLIVGNSAAGVTAAEQIRRIDQTGSIAILGREPYPAYGRPLISYLIEGKTDLDHLYYKDPEFYDRNGIQLFVGEGSKAEALDPKNHVVTCANGAQITYGRCLLATGSVPFVPAIPGLESAENVHSFFTLDDAVGAWEDVREATRIAHEQGRSSRMVVIGAGLIGMKAAECLSGFVDQVVVYDRSPRILSAVLDDQGAQVMEGLLAQRGIQCRPGLSVDHAVTDPATGRVTAVVQTDGETLDCDVVMRCVGVRPDTALAKQAQIQVGRGILCGPDMATSAPGVYAAGDNTQVTDVITGAARPLALWPNAVRQGCIAGAHMASVHLADMGCPLDPAACSGVVDKGSFAVNAVDFFDINLLNAGLVNPSPEDGCIQVSGTSQDTYMKFVFRPADSCADDYVLVGFIALNRPDNAGLYASLIEQRVAVSLVGGMDAYKRVANGADPIANLDFQDGIRWDRTHKGYPADRDRLGWLAADASASVFGKEA